MIEQYLSEKNRKRRQEKRYFFIGGILGILYIILLLIAWIIFRSPIFRMQNLVINGNSAVPTDAVVSLLQSAVLRNRGFLDSLLGMRSMLAWPKTLSRDDLAFAPQIADISMNKNYLTRTVTATVSERVPLGIWCFMQKSEECFWFDDGGILFRRSFDTQGSLMFSIHDYSENQSHLQGKILPDQFVANLLSVVDVIKKSGVDVEEIALRDLSLQELSVTTYNGPTLYFSLRFPATNDSAVLQNIMQKPEFQKLQYVDFRVENRAYYK